MIVKVSYFIRRLDPADLSGPVGGRRSVPVSGGGGRRSGPDTLPECSADGLRPTRGPLHRAGGDDGGHRGPGDQPGVCLPGWQAGS